MSKGVIIVTATVILGFLVGILALLFLVSPSKGKQLVQRAIRGKSTSAIPTEIILTFLTILTACFIWLAFLGTGSGSTTKIEAPKVGTLPTATPKPKQFKQVAPALGEAVP